MLKNRFFGLVVVALVCLAFVGCNKDPLLKVSTQTLNFEGDQVSATFDVSNAGKGTLEFTLTPDEDWIAVDAATGQAAAGEKVTVTVTLSGAAAKASLQGSIAVAAKVGGSATVAVVKGQNLFTAVYEDGLPLGDKTLTFVPGTGLSQYALGVVDNGGVLPTDPTDGELIDFTAEDPVQLNPSQSIPFYGVAQDTVYVSSKGAVKFATAEPGADELAEHFGTPGLTGLSTVDATAGGEVSWKEDALKMAVTFLNVPEVGSAKQLGNTFQFNLYFDGVLQLAYGELVNSNGLVGLSDGLGVPAGTFNNSDLTTNYNSDSLPAEGEGEVAEGEGEVAEGEGEAL